MASKVQIMKNHPKCLIYDFDGVMTNNKVLMDDEGKEYVYVNRSDGYAVSRLKEMGIDQLILSTETNQVVRRRAEKLGIEVINSVDDKRLTLTEYCEKKGINLNDVMYIGNDLNDLPAMNIVGIKGAPADASREILDIADWVSSKVGGDGVVRDLLDQFFS